MSCRSGRIPNFAAIQRSRPPEPAYRKLLQSSLPVVVAVFAGVAGLGMTALALLLVRWSYTPLPVLDQWEIFATLARHQNSYPIPLLFAQHNEHRPVLLRLFCLADIFLFQATNRFLISLLVAVQVLHAGLLIEIARRSGRFTGARLWAWAGLVLTFLFHPAQGENFTWAWQVCFLLSALTATGTLYCLCRHRAAWHDEQRKWTAYFWLAALGPAVAWLNLASGLLLWPYLLLAAVWLALPRSNIAVLALAGVAAAAAHFYGYAAPTHHAHPLDMIVYHGGRLLSYAVAYLGGSWSPHGGSMAYLLGTAGIGLFVWCCLRVRALLKDSDRTFALTMFLLAGFVLVTALTTAAGRAATAAAHNDLFIPSRYQSFALLFWVALAGLLLLDRNRWAAVVAAFLGVALAPLYQLPGMLVRSEADQQYFPRLEVSLAADVNIFPEQRMWLPSPGLWKTWREWMLARHGSVFAKPLYRTLGQPLTSLPQPPRIPRCLGFFDKTQNSIGTAPQQGIQVSGWMWDPQHSTAVPDILLTGDQNQIAGFGRTMVERPEAPKVFSEVSTAHVGFEGYLPASAIGQQVRAYGVDGTGEVICALDSAIVVQRAASSQ